MKRTLLSILAGLIMGCSEKRELPFEYKEDFRTRIGISVDAPTWIDERDYEHLGDVIDSYYEEFHKNVGYRIPVNRMLLKIREKPGLCTQNEMEIGNFNLVTGFYMAEFDFVYAVNMDPEGGLGFLPGLPHELAHRFLFFTIGDMKPRHNWPSYVGSAVGNTFNNTLKFEGDLSQQPYIDNGKCE